MKVLAGDLGGTKALLGIATFADEDGTGSASPCFSLTRRYASADFSGIAALMRQFRADAGAALDGVAGACLAVAGPVDDGGRRARFTLLPWVAEAAALEEILGLPLRLANDFAAVAAGIPALPAHGCLTLQAGEPLADGVRLAVGAGTGLGMACIVPGAGAGGFTILPSEGGNIGFAPADALQDEFAAFLRAEQGRATAQRVISGNGLVSLYRFLSARHGADIPNPLAEPDAAAAIGARALATPDSLARRTVEVFMAAYGAFSGDMALALMARGGIFLAGGVTQKLLPLLQSGTFMAAFNDKQEHANLVRRMPVHVVTAVTIGLEGAAILARRAFPAARAPVDSSQ